MVADVVVPDFWVGFSAGLFAGVAFLVVLALPSVL